MTPIYSNILPRRGAATVEQTFQNTDPIVSTNETMHAETSFSNLV